ncbi:Cupredoxin [Leucosporidium creatinivorum]|uniref:Cupredoxin n=1 Tax=Leucosporidium creatinivorum TaxID=106004 RepID=A0A1Y2E709_9BASI|nr:Cupredoxin [Leucosporidium creatinivorum]
MTAAAPARQRSKILCLTVGVIVVLAVSLGVGLGVGLKHHHAASTEVKASNSSNSPSNTTSNLQALTPQDSSSFFLRGAAAMADEPAQDRVYTFVLEERLGAPDGVEKTMLVVNGLYPGPTIEVNEGDRVIVNVTNLMPNATAIHWHGLYQRGTPYFDGTNAITQCGIPPGESLVYNFTLDGWSGTTWYHAHYSTQYTDGVTGAFIVHGKNETVPSYDAEIVVQLSDLYHGFSTDLLRQYLSTQGMTGEGLTGVTQGNEPVPDAGTINGVGQWGNSTAYSNYTLEANKTYRLRLANTGSFAASRFSVDGHILTVIEADGVPITPYEVSGLVIDVAQRYSVLLKTNRTTGAYWMRGSVQEDSFTYDEPGFNGNQLAIIRYGVDDSAMPSAELAASDPGAGDGAPGDLDVSLLVPSDFVEAPNSTISYTLTISMQNTATNNWLSFVNSTSWSPLAGQATLFDSLTLNSTGANVYDDSQLIITIPQKEVVDIVINNYDDGDHPFHLHGMKVFVMGNGAGRYQGQALNSNNPLRRDTVLLPAYTWTVLRFVADNPGMWAFHCHLSWHMAAGLLMQWSVMPAEAALLTPPQQMLDQCSMLKGISD